MKLKKVIVIGGTHGNEWTGIHIVKHHAQRLSEKFPDLELSFVFGNPRAFEANRRFTEEDLNRAFQYLHESRTSYEHARARELKDLMTKSPCFVIDLHTTTANMGKTVIISDYEKLTCHVSSELLKKIPDCRVIGSPDPQRKYLASQSKFSMMIEVGPIPNSIVEPIVLEGTLEILEATLELINSSHHDASGTLEYYEEVQDIKYPVDEKGEISAYIHSGFQGKDFVPVTDTFTPFRHFSGALVELKTNETLYPIFINEAAYYPQQLAFTLCRKKIHSY